MNRDLQSSWRRSAVFDPMNTHSQGDEPLLMYVARFNADEREWQPHRIQELVEEIETLLPLVRR